MIAALVCGRAENQPFPGRNTFPLLGRPLMAYPIMAAAHSAEVGGVFLSTDDPGMAEVGRHHRADIIDRPPELRAEDVPLERIIEHGYREITHRLRGDLEALVVLLANAPTVNSGLIDQSIEIFRADSNLDAVATVSLRHEFSPQFALKLAEGSYLRPYTELSSEASPDAYFPDSLLWVLRPSSFFRGAQPSVRPNCIVNTATQRVAPLIHEGYGDVDYAWQIPAVEEWLRRRGFTEIETPYAPPPKKTPHAAVSRTTAASRSATERRVLITTIPFGQVNRQPLDLLEAAGIEYVMNPLGRRLKEEELAELIGGFGVLIAGTEPITAKVMDAAPHLRLISRVGVGLDSVDLNAARTRGIHVTYTPDAPSPAVAELTVGMMLTLLRDISGADRNMRNGIWHRAMGRRLSELTVGVIGVGRIGKRVIRHLVGGFPGVQILGNDTVPDISFGQSCGLQWVDKETIYREADIVTLHLPLTAQTRNLITAHEIQIMKPTALLINTSRGNMIDERDLAAALRAGCLEGAAIDVFEHEPYSGELVTLERCLLTCHMGSMSQDCRYHMELEATEEVLRFLRNEALLRLVPDTEYVLSGFTS